MRKILGLLLAALLVAPASTWATATGALAGRILPVEGAPAATSVWLAPAATGSSMTSVPVAADGSFRAEGLPPGPVSVAVATANGLYAVETPVTIAPGTTRTVGLALRGRQDSNTDTGDSKEEKKKKKTGLGVWDNPLTASLIVIGSAVIIGLIIDQATKNKNKTTASPSVPGP